MIKYTFPLTKILSEKKKFTLVSRVKGLINRDALLAQEIGSCTFFLLIKLVSLSHGLVLFIFTCLVTFTLRLEAKTRVITEHLDSGGGGRGGVNVRAVEQLQNTPATNGTLTLTLTLYGPTMT